MSTDHRTLTVSNVRLVSTSWGRFIIALEGVNSKGNEAAVTVTIPWLLWPLIVAAACKAWPKERQLRMAEIEQVESSLGVQPFQLTSEP